MTGDFDDPKMDARIVPVEIEKNPFEPLHFFKNIIIAFIYFD